MTTRPTSALWISGAPGTGKTTTGWRIHELLAAAEGNAAYVDIDQLGLLGPFERLAGTAPHVVKAENARRLIDTLRTRGLRQMVISGIVDPELGEPGLSPDAAGIDLTHVRLRCEWPELRHRFLDRGSEPDALGDLEVLARHLDRRPAVTVDTTGRGVDDVARELVARYAPPRPGRWTAGSSAPAAPLPTTVLHGATAAGKSTVGWELLRRRWAAGRTTAYIDVEQLGFHTGYDRAVHAAAYAAVTHGYAHAGAQDLVVVTRDPDLVEKAHRGGALARVLLDASDDALSARVVLRAAESTGRLPGDALLGAPPEQQRAIASRAQREAAHLRRAGEHECTIDTTKRAPPEVADRIERALRDPG